VLFRSGLEILEEVTNHWQRDDGRRCVQVEMDTVSFAQVLARHLSVVSDDETEEPWAADSPDLRLLGIPLSVNEDLPHSTLVLHY